MSSRAEVERQSIISDNSPLRHHSMNQRVLGYVRQESQRGELPGKVIRSQQRKLREQEERDRYDQAKKDRIEKRIILKLMREDVNGYETLQAEIRYLFSH